MPVEIEFTKDVIDEIEIFIEEILREREPSAADIIDTIFELIAENELIIKYYKKKTAKPEVTNDIKDETRKWEKISKENPSIKKVCDNLSRVGLEINEIDENDIRVQAEEMLWKKLITQSEYNDVISCLRKAE